MSAAESSEVSFLRPSEIPVERSDFNFDDVMKRVRIGDRVAFDELYREFAPDLARFVSRALGPQTSSTRAEDLVAEVFFEVLREVNRHDICAGDFPGWLKRIASSVMVSETQVEPVDDPSDLPLDSGWTVLSELDDQVIDAMEELPLPYRQVLQLRFMQGLGINQVATAMNRSPGAIRVLQLRALRAMKRMIDPAGQQRPA